ncbi:MAG: LPS export ABC transporter ATP-binding protein [Candidatus Liberibacter asiaticus]|uniref:ABC transporter nucleotide binding/ATPase protein n=2 Tax=Liberibacter asiaticus TaxID=34021 RepID=C6XFR4_LIBAP|nr:ABC transporter nucleotide binding/ATPase protein [Candidatus Liberibacter asiaticus str. psy62]AGH16823.1 ABC transporter nucleotide binding/ATPase protein [Candidatus Liberibacter asiaticus str. gxpsy]ALK07183.1 LPS export ABC transporter ATP-binding protein [Candidatus Liberibacter asiaticus]BAP26343.1 ABC transporter nucleotide binding/ATPase [Candidatus Liberibacter asiaticus str. Ishi-1]ASK52662.1 ABC transporter ATP-binding protein [Candidatus Liberibacter asiaticus]
MKSIRNYLGIEMPEFQENRASKDSLLSACSLTKKYNSVYVVKGVDLYVKPGEIVGLLGPNGAGKTTFFYMMTGLICADSGSIKIDGNDITKMPMYRRARLGISYLPQEASIFRGLTVEENILAVLEVYEKDKKKRHEKLDSLLKEFNITKWRHVLAPLLSGGQRRRLEIARSLVSFPSYILLDEPFAGVDPVAISDIHVLIRDLASRGIGILITDHNVHEILTLIDRAYIIHAGGVLAHGTVQEIIDNQDVRRLYLGDRFAF